MKGRRVCDRLFAVDRSAWFAITAIAVIAVELLVFTRSIGDPASLRLRCVTCIGDAALIMLPYWICSPRWRAIALPTVWVVSLFLLANALYFKYWGDLFVLASIFEPSNYNSFVFKSIAPVFSARDWLYVVSPVVLTALYVILKPWTLPSCAIRRKAVAVGLCVGLYGLGFAGSIYSSSRWYAETGREGLRISDILSFRFGRHSLQTDAWHANGLAGYIVASVINSPGVSSISLTPEEDAQITQYLKTLHDESQQIATESNDSVKNLIFIIVESLDAGYMMSEADGRPIMPFLSSLVGAEGAVTCTRMVSQIGNGGSSDGQFIYNTGLLPLENAVVAQTMADRCYPSLCRAIAPRSSAELIVESSAVYNHRQTSVAYGYQKLYDMDSLRSAGLDVAAIGGDAAVMSFAFDRIMNMEQPFVAEITTLSMHFPFEQVGFEPKPWINGISDSKFVRRYCQAAHYTDSVIATFVSKIYDSKLADNTVVVIASDHDVVPENIRDYEAPTDRPIVFAALGTGRTLHHTQPMGQVDLYPTVLDLMGVKGKEVWYGMGHSIVSEPPTAAISRTGRVEGSADEAQLQRLRRAFTLSDTLIRSGRFVVPHE